jgi:hypothetical protein
MEKKKYEMAFGIYDRETTEFVTEDEEFEIEFNPETPGMGLTPLISKRVSLIENYEEDREDQENEELEETEDQ